MDDERRYPIRWYVHAKSERSGTVRARTFYVSTRGLLMHAPARYRTGDILDLEIFIQPTISLHCKARVCASETPYFTEFVSFADGDQKVLNDTLLGVRRNRLKRI